MTRRYLSRWTMWSLVVLGLGPGCGDGESSAPPPAIVRGCLGACCPNGELNDGEECDDGNLNAGDSCLPNCSDAFCGDGIVRTVYPPGCEGVLSQQDECPPVEECDDLNDEDGDGCSSACEIE